MSAPTVASVLLLADADRQRALAPALRVVGEPVRYALEVADPAWTPRRRMWNVVVIDGESIRRDAAREQLLAALTTEKRGTVLYVLSPLPSALEAEQALAWADDLILQGWAFEERLRRRVQSVALAPWRQSVALRMQAERLGDRRLRVLRTAEAPTRAAAQGAGAHRGARVAGLEERARALGDRWPTLVAEAFREGVRAMREGVDRGCEELMAECRERLALLPDERATPEELVAKARMMGACDAVLAVRYQLDRVARELEASREAERRGDR